VPLYSARSQSTIAEAPSSWRMLHSTWGRSPRAAWASRTMTFRSAPTCGARS